jgi:hypothetical protein
VPALHTRSSLFKLFSIRSQDLSGARKYNKNARQDGEQGLSSQDKDTSAQTATA